MEPDIRPVLLGLCAVIDTIGTKVNLVREDEQGGHRVVSH